MKKMLLSLGIMVVVLSVSSTNVFALSLPAPNTVVDGVPVAAQFDEFYSYPTQLLTQLGFAGFNGAAGVGGLDIVLMTQAGGIDNTPVAGGFTFEDPVPSAAGATSSFSGTWGAGIRPGGPVTVDNLLAYIHNQFGPDQNIPVFTFDLVEPGSAAQRDLNLVANFIIWDPAANGGLGAEITSWSLDRNPNNIFDNSEYVLAEGFISVTGISNTVYSFSTTGSGQHDFLAYAPGMDLSLYDGLGYEFHIFADFINLQGSGEEAFISGAITTPPSNSVPEPASMILMGMGLTGMAFRRKFRKQ